MAIISVKEKSGIPKYKQIIASVEDAIEQGTLLKGDKLPSLNAIRNKFSLSRDTVLMAFNELKTRGIIHSIAGKGYYVKSVNLNVSKKIFLLFDELNSFKEDLYSSFLGNLEEEVQVDIFFHHFNYDVFTKLIYDNIGTYNYYIIMPANFKNTKTVLEKLPLDKVYILDQTNDDLKEYPAIYQNFEKDIFNSLSQANFLIKKYQRLILLFPEKKQPQGMLRGFQNFRKANSIDHVVINSLDNITPKKGEVYLILDDRNLIILIKKIKTEALIIGEDIGIISYNDTLLKEVVEGGITTISTDFKKMGTRLAKMVLNNEHDKIENPNHLIIRKSL
ncbi:MAG: GntR family transcriptional regulator [Flavobacteriaceae bacterium]|nr:GntR family transcriptional regulator [Flavobacteriaceae bacterium]